MCLINYLPVWKTLPWAPGSPQNKIHSPACGITSLSWLTDHLAKALECFSPLEEIWGFKEQEEDSHLLSKHIVPCCKLIFIPRWKVGFCHWGLLFQAVCVASNCHCPGKLTNFVTKSNRNALAPHLPAVAHWLLPNHSKFYHIHFTVCSSISCPDL